MLDHSRHGDDFAPAYDEGPRLALGSRDLGVDEHVLDLLPAPGEPVARSPASYLKACELGLDRPRAPADAALERDRGLLEPDAVVLAHRRQPLAELDAARALGRGEEDVEPGRPLLGHAEEVRLGARVEPAQEREQLVADQASPRGGIRAVAPKLEALG